MLSEPSLYSMVMWSSASKAADDPLSWPKLPKIDVSPHHWPVAAPHAPLLSPQASRVVWIRSPLPLDKPGQMNSGPLPDSVGGKRPGTSVVFAEIRWFVAGEIALKL